MAEEEKNFSVWSFIKGFGKLLVGTLLVLQGILGLVALLIVIGLVTNIGNGFMGGKGGPLPAVPDEAALLINPNGALVEESEAADPFEEALEAAYGVEDPDQIEVGELVRAIRHAATDERITGIVLDLRDLYIPPIYASKVYDVAAALDAFRKDSGKKIYAVGDYYTQEQYLLAARADEIHMHDKGSIVLIGYGAYEVYLKSFLEKLLITPHVFRVGTFKAAVEPFLRDDMSPEAKEANLAYLGSLWGGYAAEVEKSRKLPAGSIDRFANDFNGALRKSGGDLAKAALSAKLVDKLSSRQAQLKAMKAHFGETDDGDFYRHVEVDDYLRAIGQPHDDADPDVAIITVAGSIVDGEVSPGLGAGGDTIADYLEQAVSDDEVKAVVLRVDSPGGSVFASELIRDGVIALKEAGKPVVVSMGSLAASGGYWVSAPADAIYAAPTTVTGSIGIFGFFATFEKAAERWGVTVDGVGTTALSPIYGVGAGPLPDNLADIFQQSIEDGYNDFLDVVAEGRKLDRAYVDQIGQGRVWIGSKAKDLKLVDKIGDLDAAVKDAAQRAKLEQYDQVKIRETQSPFEALFGQAAARAMAALGVDIDDARRGQSFLRKAVTAVKEQIRFFDEFNDPQAIYARCLSCGH